MGELHLTVLKDRLLREFKVNVKVGKPQVVYRETISKSVEIEGKFEREIGDKRHFASLFLRLEPQGRGKGVEFLNLKGGEIHEEFLQAVEEGIKEATLSGIISGYPVVDLRVILIDGSFSEIDSSPLAYRVCTFQTFREGCKKACPILLEPIMAIEVILPEEFMGEVIGDLNSRKGKIENIFLRGKTRVIKALIPLKEMFGYATSLRSQSQGRGNFSMQFSHYGHSLGE